MEKVHDGGARGEVFGKGGGGGEIERCVHGEGVSVCGGCGIVAFPVL